LLSHVCVDSADLCHMQGLCTLALVHLGVSLHASTRLRTSPRASATSLHISACLSTFPRVFTRLHTTPAHSCTSLYVPACLYASPRISVHPYVPPHIPTRPHMLLHTPTHSCILTLLCTSPHKLMQIPTYFCRPDLVVLLQPCIILSGNS